MNSVAMISAVIEADADVTAWLDRYGRRRWFYRPFTPKRFSRKWPLPGTPGSTVYEAELARLRVAFIEGKLKNIGDPASTETLFLKGSIGWCIDRFRASDEFKKMSDNTKKSYVRYLDNIKSSRLGPAMMRHLITQVVIKFRNEIPSTSAADGHVYAFSKLWDWTLHNLMDDVPLKGSNPCHGIQKRHDKSKQHSYEPWPREVLDAVLAIAPIEISTAIEVLLGSAQRVNDATTLREQHIVDGKISVPVEPTEFEQGKTGERIFIVATERMMKAVENRPHQQSQHILNSSRGRKWASGDSLSEMITRWVDKVSPPGTYTTHGLRVNAGIELALAGCEIEELKAVLGHRTAAMVGHYLKKMNRLHNAMTAVKKRNRWERRRVAEVEAKAAAKAGTGTKAELGKPRKSHERAKL